MGMTTIIIGIVCLVVGFIAGWAWADRPGRTYDIRVK
jgi:hypothetical protein